VASEVMKLIFAVLDVSFNSGHYTVIMKQQFLYINYVKLSMLTSNRMCRQFVEFTSTSLDVVAVSRQPVQVVGVDRMG